ncbi:hypothetical protein D3C77_762580 [compost metagenome]
MHPFHAVPAHFNGEVHQKDGVFRHDTHQHQNADENGHGKRVLRDDERHGHAANGEWQ